VNIDVGGALELVRMLLSRDIWILSNDVEPMVVIGMQKSTTHIVLPLKTLIGLDDDIAVIMRIIIIIVDIHIEMGDCFRIKI
jgi:hypothetical protein